LRTDLFDYELPPERIALRPASPRDAARLLVVRPGVAPELEDRSIGDLPALLQPGDELVVNDSKVIPARLIGERVRGEARAKIETTLIRREGAEHWRALAKPLKRLKPGDRIRFGHESRVCLLGALDATVEEIGEGEVLLRFDFHGPVLEEAIEALGHVPLPPYIAARREDDERDRIDYQTVFAKHQGSVAAPTARCSSSLSRRPRSARVARRASSCSRAASSSSGSCRGFCGNIRSARPGRKTTLNARPRACAGLVTSTRP